ncbi:XK-related protein 8.3 [Neosynchiropus ocellatus]
MECAAFSRYSWIDFAFSVIGVCTFLIDWGSDVWVATEFYRRGNLLWFGAMVGLMVVSSVVVQMFSWFWFKYDRQIPGFWTHSMGGSVLFGDKVKLSCVLHVLQLGFLCRHISAIRQGFKVWWRKEEGSEYAVYLTHDLSMLRLIETFCESAPQLTLMIYVMLCTNRARAVQFVSIAASTTSIAWMVLDYHRSLRSFLPDKAKQGWAASLIYFLWNLLLISPRVVALALFASVLQGYVAVHFLLIWPVFVIWVWQQKTNFMDSCGGEWLYRATVGLIWYFSWFNVAEGRTRGRSIIYHAVITADSGILLATWWSYRDPELSEPYALALMIALPLIYLLGLLFKTLYYCCFHPKLWRPPTREPEQPDDLPDADVSFKNVSIQDGAATSRVQLLNKRMAQSASNFYSLQGVSLGTDADDHLGITETMAELSTADFVFTALGLGFMLIDIVLDICTAVNFCLNGDYACFVALLLVLLGSSFLVNTFSWLWLKADRVLIPGLAKKSVKQLAVIHICQLQILARRGELLQRLSDLGSMTREDKELAVFLQHDVGLLALFESYSESCPHLVLMLTIYLRRGQLGAANVLKTAASIFFTAFGVTLYHRCLRGFLPEKNNQPIVSSAVYLIWNFFFIGSRVLALSLFASVFPCHMPAHFLCWWMLYVFVAWRLKTNLMDTAAGEWLYRATVALIWYFNWFNVVEGPTKTRAVLYHALRLVDTLVLCAVVTRETHSDPQFYSSPRFYVTICVGICFVFGLMLKLIYYKSCHPRDFKKQDTFEAPLTLRACSLAEEDYDLHSDSPSAAGADMNRSMDAVPTNLCNRRMAAQAKIFYSSLDLKNADNAGPSC